MDGWMDQVKCVSRYYHHQLECGDMFYENNNNIKIYIATKIIHTKSTTTIFIYLYNKKNTVTKNLMLFLC